jgi:hypothetical protein
MTAARPTTPPPYDGRPFTPIGRLTADEHTWGRRLVQRGWRELGWHVVGRDAAGDLDPPARPEQDTGRRARMSDLRDVQHRLSTLLDSWIGELGGDTLASLGTDELDIIREVISVELRQRPGDLRKIEAGIWPGRENGG